MKTAMNDSSIEIDERSSFMLRTDKDRPGKVI